MSYTIKEKNKIFKKICNRISNGEALRYIINKEDTFSSTVFFELIDGDEDKNKQYARACENRADKIFDEMLDIADDQEGDIIILENGNEVTNHNVINRSRVRIDTRKWILSKMNPKKYGDKLEVDQKQKQVIQFENVSKQFSDK